MRGMRAGRGNDITVELSLSSRHFLLGISKNKGKEASLYLSIAFGWNRMVQPGKPVLVPARGETCLRWP